MLQPAFQANPIITPPTYNPSNRIPQSESSRPARALGRHDVPAANARGPRPSRGSSSTLPTNRRRHAQQAAGRGKRAADLLASFFPAARNISMEECRRSARAAENTGPHSGLPHRRRRGAGSSLYLVSPCITPANEGRHPGHVVGPAALIIGASRACALQRDTMCIEREGARGARNGDVEERAKIARTRAHRPVCLFLPSNYDG